MYQLVFKRKIDPIRETLAAIYKINQGISKIEYLLDKLNSRKDKLIEYAISLENRGERFLAKKYVEEAKRIEEFYNGLSDLKLVLLKISMGLERALVTHNFRKLAEELIILFGNIKKLPEFAIPEVGNIIMDVESSIAKLRDFSYTIDDLSFNITSDNEIDKILSEAREIIKKKFKLPEPPQGVG